MLRWPLNLDYEMLNEIILTKCFIELKPQDRVTLLQSYLCKNLYVSPDNCTLETNLFPEISRHIISMISTILGKDNNPAIDEFVLVCIMSIFPFTMKPLTKLNYAQFLDDKIHHQLS